jgi:hypothetical protein
LICIISSTTRGAARASIHPIEWVDARFLPKTQLRNFSRIAEAWAVPMLFILCELHWRNREVWNLERQAAATRLQTDGYIPEMAGIVLSVTPR